MNPSPFMLPNAETVMPRPGLTRSQTTFSDQRVEVKPVTSPHAVGAVEETKIPVRPNMMGRASTAPLPFLPRINSNASPSTPPSRKPLKRFRTWGPSSTAVQPDFPERFEITPKFGQTAKTSLVTCVTVEGQRGSKGDTRGCGLTALVPSLAKKHSPVNEKCCQLNQIPQLWSLLKAQPNVWSSSFDGQEILHFTRVTVVRTGPDHDGQYRYIIAALLPAVSKSVPQPDIPNAQTQTRPPLKHAPTWSPGSSNTMSGPVRAQSWSNPAPHLPATFSIGGGDSEIMLKRDSIIEISFVGTRPEEETKMTIQMKDHPDLLRALTEHPQAIIVQDEHGKAIGVQKLVTCIVSLRTVRVFARAGDRPKLANPFKVVQLVSGNSMNPDGTWNLGSYSAGLALAKKAVLASQRFVVPTA